MNVEEKILFSKEERESIMSYANQWRDREMSVKHEGKQNLCNEIIQPKSII